MLKGVKTGSTACEGDTLSLSFLASSFEEDAQGILDTIVPLRKNISYRAQFYVFLTLRFFLAPTGQCQFVLLGFWSRKQKKMTSLFHESQFWEWKQLFLQVLKTRVLSKNTILDTLVLPSFHNVLVANLDGYGTL